jgi:hypothetical protein
MNKNIVHTLASERKRIEPSHKMTSTRKKHLFNCAIKNDSYTTNNLPKRDVLPIYLLR